MLALLANINRGKGKPPVRVEDMQLIRRREKSSVARLDAFLRARAARPPK